jgi:alkylation response protein AidB-like acyl-CoA dehydrogenase
VALQLADLNLSDERTEFRDTLRRFFDEHAPITEVRRVMEAGEGISPSIWKLASEELGLAGIAIAEEFGGQGFGLKELAIALGETGRSLAPIPLFASAALAAPVVQAVAGVGQGADFLEPIAAGRVATLAWVEAKGDWDAAAVEMEASAAGDVYLLSGAKHFVLDAPHAEQLFVVARLPGTTGANGLGLFAVDTAAKGVRVEQCETLDLTRPLSIVHFEDVEAVAVGAVGRSGVAIRAALDESTALLCAEMVGGMQRVLETAVDYAAERHQFSRPIGSFQAIKHKCADLLIDFEGSRTVSDGAITAFEEGDGERSLLASVAKSHVGPAYLRVTTENMQIQGGVGYTWEYDAHLYFRRALASTAMLGDASAHQERLARLVAGAAVGADGENGAAGSKGGK